ncbi:MAG: thioredoxin family protein [Gemmatimonadales bacterium]
MLSLAVAALIACSPGNDPGLRPLPLAAPVASDSLEDLYRSGRTWEDFYAAVNARRVLWTDNYEGPGLPDSLLTRARAVGGTWRFLVVAIDSCSDSANTIPFLAKLVDAVPGLELRIVDPTAGRWVMEAHRTADGRAATPTVILLDESFGERGCFVERPVALRKMLAEAQGGDQDRFESKMAWYREDAGRSTVADLIGLLESAAAGPTHCDPGA